MSKRLKGLKRLAALGEKLPLPSSAPVMLASPLDLITAFVKAWDAGDAEAIANLFAEDADFINGVGLWWSSRTAIRRAHAWGFERMYRDSSLAIEKLSQRLLGEAAAVVHVRWRIDGQIDPNGQALESRRGVMSAVVVRLDDGGWLGVSAQNTDISPAADSNISRDGVLTPTSYIPTTAVPSKEQEDATTRAARELG